MVLPTRTYRRNVKPDTSRAWVIATSSFIIVLLVKGTIKCFGVLLPELQREFSTDTWAIGLTVTLGQCFGAILCPFTVAISRRMTPRYTVMVFGLLSATGLVLGSLAKTLTVFAISILLTGYGIGANAICFAELSNYFNDYYAIAAAYSNAGVGVGVLILPLLTQFFIDVYGWRGALLLIGGLNLHVIVCGTSLRAYFVNNHAVTMRSLANDSRIEENSTYMKIASDMGLDMFKNSEFLSLILIAVGGGYVISGWTLYLVPHAIQIGIEPYDAAILATVGGVGHILGSIIYPFLTSTFSIKQILYAATVSNSISLLIDSISSMYHSYVGLMVSYVTFGVGRAVVFVNLYALIHEEIDGNRKSIVVLWTYFSDSFGSIVSSFWSGWLFDQTCSYSASFLVLSAVPLLSTFPRLLLDVSQHIRNKRLYKPIP